MLISYNWIKTYFKDSIPQPKELADIITMGAFEIDGMEEKEIGGVKDTILDVKVLPDRSPYALSHRYLAQEIGALLSKQIIIPEIKSVDVSEDVSTLALSVEAGLTPAGELYCKRYAGRVVQGVSVSDSPVWLKTQLETLGQRSISTIVDLTNFVMLDIGQPLHAFDADKVEGNIRVRKANEGEEITLLDGTVLKLNSSMLVIADDKAPLALAGIKGGKKAEVTRDTKNIILEAACFDSTTTRKTSQVVGIKNDSSKRFENGVTPERAGLALAILSGRIAELNPGAKFGEVTDEYPEPVERRNFEVSVAYISERLGVSIPKETVVEILSRVDIVASDSESTEGNLLVSVPAYRPDLLIAEDIIEEVGRIYGYDKVVGTVPGPESDRRINKNFYYHNAIRKALIQIGFSEIYTYTLTDAGDTKLANPLTVERAFLRNNISDLMSKKALFNLKNIDLLGLKEARVFEIGKVFGGSVLDERFSLAFSIARSKQPKGHDAKIELTAIAHHVLEMIGAGKDGVAYPEFRYIELTGDAQTPCSGFVIEFDLDALVESLPVPTADLEMNPLPQIKFKPISTYPFSVRDIAVFVPGEKGQEAEVESVIRASLAAEKLESLLTRSTLFDVFTKNKEGESVRTSYAYRLVFQSSEKTLSEEEIHSCMQAVTKAFVAKAWEVR
jgi:phenylalanyl-tRNA synthetase beta chain